MSEKPHVFAPVGRNQGACGCRACNPNAWWMVVCDICGNKRCPHATDHALACTESNEPGQPGSDYKARQPIDVGAILDASERPSE